MACIGALSFSKSLLLECILEQEMKSVKNFEVVGVLNKIEEEQKESGYLFLPLFSREREIEA